MKKTAMIVALAAGLVGCMASTPVKKETAQANYEYEFKQQEAKNDRLIAVISPTFLQNSYANDPLLATSVSNALYELFSKKGFNTSGPFASSDDLTYSAKKDTYLVARPELKIILSESSTQKSCTMNYCSQEGEFTVSGEFYVKLYEPMSEQTIINKRVNLSDLGISESYIRQWKKPAQGSLVGQLIAATETGQPEQLVDNYDKARGDALNAFFTLSMAKLEAYLSSEEILSYSSDVQELKQRKRF